MEPRTHVPLEVRLGELAEIREARTFHYRSANPELADESRELYRGMRERMRSVLRLRRTYDEIRKMREARRERREQRGRTLNLTRRIIDYAGLFSGNRSQNKESRTENNT
jgi:hypothetical protein